VGVLSIGTLFQPSLKIEALGSVERDWVSIKEIRNNGVVAICCELVCNQLAVLPDTDHIWKEENSSVFVDGIASWFSDVGFDVTDFDGLAGWLAAAEVN